MGKEEMNQIASLNISTQRSERVSNRGAPVRSGPEAETATLHILPLRRRPLDVTEWIRARQKLGQIAVLPAGWDSMGGQAPDSQTIFFAAEMLAPLENQGLPAPAIHPSADGAVYAEWHANGLDIEVVFEAPYEVTIIVEDARHEIPTRTLEARDMAPALEALRSLISR